MSTLTRKYNQSVTLQQHQGVFSKQIVNNQNKLITQLSANHPSLLSRWVDQDGYRPPNQNLHQLIGSRKQIESAGPSYIELNATPAMVQKQLQDAIQNPNTPFGQYVQKIFAEQNAKATAAVDPRQMRQGKRRQAGGTDMPMDTGAELAQLELTQPIQRPFQMTGDMQVMQQMTMPNPPDRYAQFGGPQSVYDPNIPNAWYFADPNSNKRARIGSYTQGQRTFVGDGIETHLSQVPLNTSIPMSADRPYITNRPTATGANAPTGQQYENAYGPAPSTY